MPGGNSIWFHKGFLLAWNSCVLMWVTHAVFILDALEITMKGNYILLQVMLHGATPHRGLRGSHAATLHRGAGVHTQRSHHGFFFVVLFFQIPIVAAHEGVAAERDAKSIPFGLLPLQTDGR